MSWLIVAVHFLLLTAVGSYVVQQNFTAPNGVLQNAGFPGNYVPNSRARYWISIPDLDKFISIQFTFFQTEGYASSNCVFDWLAVYDGQNASSLGTVCSVPNLSQQNLGMFCNFHAPQLNTPMVQNTTQLIIEFCTDKYIQMHGFSMKWSTSPTPPIPTPSPTPTPAPTAPPVTICGNNITLFPGHPVMLNSPGWPPNPYAPNLHCTWNINSTNGKIAILTNFFDVEGYSPSCYVDKLVLTRLNGNSYKYCGEVGPSWQNAGSPIKIEFISDDQVSRFGFHLVLFAPVPPTSQPPVNPHCNTVYNLTTTQSTVELFSPGWPDLYPNNIFCNWTIWNGLFSQNYSVKFLFITFGTEPGFDVLDVLPNVGDSEEFDGYLPANDTALFTAANMAVNFHTDGSTIGPGFHILVSLVMTPFSCADGQFKCKTVNKCIPGKQRCDGTAQCADNSDENMLWCLAPLICGKQVIQPNIFVPTNRIINGTQSKPGSWPWAVSFRFRDPDYPNPHACDGTLISSHWIISAARCFYGGSGHGVVKTGLEYIVKVGSYYKDMQDLPWEQDFNITAIYLHPHFNSVTHANDIAMIKLAGDVMYPFNNHTGLACLPSKGYIVPPGTSCVVVGWGITMGTGDDELLRQVLAPVFPSSQCNDTSHYNGRITNSMLCAGYEGGMKDACIGDTGGPLVCKDATQRWVVQGVVSWGRGCAFPKYPTVYSRVSSFVDFVNVIANKYD